MGLRVLPLAQPTPLRNVLRPWQSSAKTLQRMISQSDAPCDGVVIDSTLLPCEKGLLEAGNAANVQTILDRLRSASDHAIQAARAHPRVKKARRQLYGWRATVPGIIDAVDLDASSSTPLTLRRKGQPRRASSHGPRQ